MKKQIKKLKKIKLPFKPRGKKNGIWKKINEKLTSSNTNNNKKTD